MRYHNAFQDVDQAVGAILVDSKPNNHLGDCNDDSEQVLFGTRSSESFFLKSLSVVLVQECSFWMDCELRPKTYLHCLSARDVLVRVVGLLENPCQSKQQAFCLVDLSLEAVGYCSKLRARESRVPVVLKCQHRASKTDIDPHLVGSMLLLPTSWSGDLHADARCRSTIVFVDQENHIDLAHRAKDFLVVQVAQPDSFVVDLQLERFAPCNCDR